MNRILGSVVLAAAAFTLAFAAAGWASPAVAQASCGKFTGPAWTWTSSLSPQKKQGTTWTVTARGVPCAFAKTTAKALVKTPFRGEANTRLKSPKGWACIAGGGNAHGGKGTPGYCSQGSKSFQWGPALGS